MSKYREAAEMHGKAADGSETLYAIDKLEAVRDRISEGASWKRANEKAKSENCYTRAGEMLPSVKKYTSPASYQLMQRQIAEK